MKVAKIDSNPELKSVLAELTADGVSQQDIAHTMGVKDRGTVAAWQKRPEIQQMVSKIIRERANRILSHTTVAIEKLLTNPNAKFDLETLLKVYEKFHGTTININDKPDAAKALEEMFLAAHSNPELAQALSDLLPADGRLPEGVEAPEPS